MEPLSLFHIDFCPKFQVFEYKVERWSQNFTSPNEWCHNLIKNKNYYNVILKMTSRKAEWELYRRNGSYTGGIGTKSIGFGATQESNWWNGCFCLYNQNIPGGMRGAPLGGVATALGPYYPVLHFSELRFHQNLVRNGSSSKLSIRSTIYLLFYSENSGKKAP